MISQHRPKARKTAFDIRSIIGSNNDNKHELSRREPVSQIDESQGLTRYGAIASKRQTDAVEGRDSSLHSYRCRSCSAVPSKKSFDHGQCHYPSFCHSDERQWLKKMSSEADIALEHGNQMPLPAFNAVPVSSVPMHNHEAHEEPCDQQRCLDHGQNHGQRSPTRCGTSFVDPRVTKAHQYMTNAEKYRFFHSFAPHIAQDLRSGYIMHAGLLPAFTAAYSRPDLIATHHASRRIRTTFTRSQLKVLEKRFKSSHYIVGDERKQLAEELSLNESQVKIWFQNRRTKYKQDKEFEELGKSKTVKRKGEHHVRKWQMETKTNETQCSSDSEDSDRNPPFPSKQNAVSEK